MKKYIAILLCTAFILGLTVPTNVLAVDYSDSNGVITQAQYAPAGVDINAPITGEKWGEPTISVDKDSENAFLWQHNALPEESSMDIYFRWDDTYIYIGVVSPDEDPRGSDDSWTGDGLQFKIAAGVTMPADALNAYFTLADDKRSVTAGDSIANYDKSLQMIDGYMHAAIAIPFDALGMTAADVKAGTPLSFSMLRISGTRNHEYAGWLAWGAFYGVGNDYNKTCTGDNVIILSSTTADINTVIPADKAYTAPDLSDMITSDTWGMPTVSVNADSYNASLLQYNAKPEDVKMDIYTLWDDKYLYLGVVSPDADPKGSDDAWTGDGIQFKLSAGASMSASAKNMYITLGANGSSVTMGATDDKTDYEYNLIIRDGVMYVAVAIPFEDLGLSKADVKAGALFSFSIIRISGTSDHEYAGWLAYGAFFGANHDYNPDCFTDNVIVLTNSASANATTLVSDKTDEPISVNDVISEEIWGKPAISANKDSYNASLKRYNAEPEDIEMDIYVRWDAKYLYLGVVSPDADPKGSNEAYTGDGIQFKISAGTTMAATAKNVYITLGENGRRVTMGATDDKTDYEYSLTMQDGKMYVAIAIPHEDLGYSSDEIKNGAAYSFSIIRISGTRDHEYAGWLAYGAFFGVNSDNNPDCFADNIIVLSDPSEIGEEEGDVFQSLLTDMPSLANRVMDEQGIGGGHKIVTTEKGTFAVYVTLADILHSNGHTALNEFSLQKISDGTVVEVGYGYTYSGSQDIVADKDGNVYVVGGGTDWTMKKLLSGNDYAANPEKAILNIWFYDDDVGFMNGYTAYKEFTQTTVGYEYLTSAIDVEAGKIFTVYVGQTEGGNNIIEYFTFDTSSMTWEDDSVSIEISQYPDSVYAYVSGGSFGIVYGSKTRIYNVLADGTEKVIDDGRLMDAYKDDDGSVRLVYADTDNAAVKIRVIDSNGSISGATGTLLPASYLYVQISVGGKYYIIGFSKTDAAEAIVYASDSGDAFAEQKRIKLDESVVVNAALMIARAENGSVASNDVVIMFAGSRGLNTRWYCTNITLE